MTGGRHPLGFKPQYKNKIMIGLIKKVIIALLFQKI